MRQSKDCRLYTNGIQCKNRKKNFIGGSQEHFLHKSAIWDRTPPTYTSNVVYMCVGGFMGSKSSNGIQLSQFVQKLLHFS